MREPASAWRSKASYLTQALLIALIGSEAFAREASFGRLPVHFEPNLGQLDKNVRFFARGKGYGVSLPGSEADVIFAFTDNAKTSRPIRMRMVGARSGAPVQGENRMRGVTNYFIGTDPKRWRTNIPQYERVRYGSVYPGIDLIFHDSSGWLEYDFVLSPDADPAAIAFEYEGAESIHIGANGDLVLRTRSGEFRHRRPVAFQEIEGRRVEVSANYVVQDKKIAFRIGAYDRRNSLVIDPVLSFSKLLGGSGDESGDAIALDAAGSVYLTGRTYSTGFSGADLYVAKLDSPGNSLLYLSLVGGSKEERGLGIAVDSAGAAFITGVTSSFDFPVQSAYQPTANGGIDDAFAIKLSPGGDSLIYSTYLGGAGWDRGNAIAVDSSGSAYIAGTTDSFNFPKVNAYPSVFRQMSNAFVTKLAPNGASLLYSTLLGGDSIDEGRAIAVDSSGGAYVTGSTESDNFPIQSAYSPLFNGFIDAFVTKLTPAGNALQYSTFLGGVGADYGNGIAVDSTGAAYIVGATSSANFPVMAGYQLTFQGQADVFVTKMSPAGQPVFSTFIGGNSSDLGKAIAIDAAGASYVTGSTYSSNFPTSSAFDSTIQPGLDAFVTKLGPTGSTLAYSSFLGGGGDETGEGIAVDSSGAAFIAGTTNSADFPVVPAAAGPLNADAFVAKVAADGLLPVRVTFTTEPPGLSVFADGVFMATPSFRDWLPGSQHTIDAYSSVPIGMTLWAFDKWSHGGPKAQTVVATAPTTYTANFKQVSCSYTVSPASPVLSPAGAFLDITVTAGPGCPWSFSSNAGWIAFTYATPAAGNGSVTFSVESNSGANRVGTISVAGQTVTVTQNGLGLRAATAVLRDNSGAIRISAYPSANLPSSGGLFAGDPASSQAPDGDTFVAARANSNALWVNIFDSGTQTWAGWQSGGGAIQGIASIAVDSGGTAWIAAKDSFGSYWLVNYTRGAGFGSWIHLLGAFTTDPVVTTCGDGSVYVVGKDSFNALWSGRYIPGAGFQNFVLGGGVVKGKPSVSCGNDNAIYIAARDNFNSSWIARVSGAVWTGWFNGGASANIDPRAAALGGSVALAILDAGGSVWRASFTEGAGNGWQAWTSVGGSLQDIAAAGTSGQLYVAGRTASGDLWWWRQTGSVWTWIGNLGVTAGGLSAAPK